jgi:molybdopterin-guanine dinucleotide biosynthesis protein B
MRALAVTGFSGSGKTTLIRAVIERLVARGERVAAVKHTHHELNEEDRGDTSIFRRAGAEPVVLAGDREAVMFLRAGIERFAFADPREIVDVIARTDGAIDVVLIEGYKNLDTWARIEAPATADDALAILDRMARP